LDAGSSNLCAQKDADPGFEEKETGKLVYMAISYENSGEQAHIKIYRNENSSVNIPRGYRYLEKQAMSRRFLVFLLVS